MKTYNRYKWKNYCANVYGNDCDCVCLDLKEKREVYRYDLGDPADTNFGEFTKNDMLEKVKRNPKETITESEYAHGIPFFDNFI